MYQYVGPNPATRLRWILETNSIPLTRRLGQLGRSLYLSTVIESRNRMLIGTLQGLSFIFMALLFTILKSHVADWHRFRSGMWCYLASIAVSGLTGAWVGTVQGYYYDLGYAATAILYSVSVLFVFEALLSADGETNDDDG